MKNTKASKTYEFSWEGINKHGAKVLGTNSGVNIALVKAELRHQGVIITKIKRKTTGLFAKRDKKIKGNDVTVFTRQLSTMIAAGIPIAQAFNILGQGSDNGNMRKMIMQIKTDVESGLALADSMKKFPEHFDDLFCNLIYAGEQSGSLESMLNRLAVYKEKTESLKKKIKKALMYPIVVLAISFLVSAGLLIFVVPQFASIFTNSSTHAKLPLLTEYVVKASDGLQAYWYIVLGFFIALIYSFKYFRRTSAKFADKVDYYLIRMPIFGSIIKKAIIARFARTLATTFAAGMPLVEALAAVSGAAGNRIFTKGINAIREQVTQGTQLQHAMNESHLFPSMVVQMVAIGEESGALETMLSKIAEYYEELVDSAVDNLSTLIEPLLMVVLAAIIGTMVVAMYLPIFKLGEIF